MIKKIDILGMSVDNYTVRESLLRLDTYMSSTALSIIETVTMKKLVLSAENPKIKKCIEQADLCVFGDKEILVETGNATIQRIREIKEQDFMYELLKRVVRNQKSVFLIANTREETDRLCEFMQEQNPKFIVAGSYAIEECTTDMDTIVNEINGATPDMVISALDSPMEEEFLLAHKDKIGAGIWYGIGSDYRKKAGGNLVGDTLKKLAFRGRLHMSVSKYESENKDRK